MYKINTIIAFLAAGLLLACGGPSKSSQKGTMSSAPPPPGGKAVKIDREVSQSDTKDFASAVAFYQKKAKSGWTKTSCKAAAERFQDIVDSNVKMIEARFNSGLSFQNCGMDKAAEKEYQKALRINPGHAESLSNLGRIYFKGGNETRAKEYWKKAVSANGRIAAPRNNLAWLMLRDVRAGTASIASKEKAITGELSRALAVDNENVESYTLYGLMYLEGSKKNKSRLTLARLLLETGMNIDPKYAPLHNAFGLLRLKQDDVPQALKSFRTAVALDSKFTEAHRNIGNIVLDFRKYDEAKSSFAVVLALSPKDYDAHLGMGYALRGLNDFKGAEKSYLTARKLNSKRGEADYNLGVLYQDFLSTKTEDLKKAQGFLRKAVGFFNAVALKSQASSKMKKKAKLNLKTCNKNIKNLTQTIKFQAEMKSSN